MGRLTACIGGLGVCLGLGVALAAAAERVTQADLLRRVVDLRRLPIPAAGERTGVFSSAARIARPADASSAPGPFLRRTDDGWGVMAEIEGPGAITRLWCDPPSGPLRILLDDETVFDASIEELLAGTTEAFAPPLVMPPSTSCVPMGFARQAVVMTRNASLRYEASYVRFAAGTEVERFSPKLDDGARQALADVQRILQSGPRDSELFGPGKRPMPVAIEQKIGPGEKLAETVDGDGTVRGLYIALTDRTDPRGNYPLHRVILRLFFDGDSQPSVEAPLTAFFGSGFEPARFNALALGTDKDLRVPLPERRMGQDRFMYCLYPMPFRDGVRIELENRNTQRKPIGLLVIMMVDTDSPPEGAWRFFARFRAEQPCREAKFLLLEADGPGRVVGLSLNVDIPRVGWWGAGSGLAWLDGADAPAYWSTAGDALLGGGGGGVEVGTRPLAGVTRTGPYGKSSGYRLLIPDSLAFDRSIRLALQNAAPGDQRDLYYGAVTYWYAAPSARHAMTRVEERDLAVPGLRFPEAVEFETNIRTPNWGHPLREEFTDVEFSGGVAATIGIDGPVQVNIPTDRQRTVRLKLRVSPRKPFDQIVVLDPADKPLATIPYARTTDGVFEVGTTTLAPGDNLFTVRAPRGTILDCWILEDPE